ncbi:MAG TPA: alpha,alpha-trehalase TreF [Ramlibacter sp.]|uniref:alpha,alpha-trehalase TreF n=1 Tax=Ramlibacter sp. TaxID=1917967 RepID=UPI002D0018B0|nr:alpha,alpha-trehalase TreF [Ramlibacter sp.]HVZ42750.1 alpha,alpha-trehalase TreF [Ramlibacter sp.]
MLLPDPRPEVRAARAAKSPPADEQTPADRYQELFVAVQRAAIFTDSKTFVDCAPKHAPEEIVAAYRAQVDRAGFDLGAFVRMHFVPPRTAQSGFVAVPGQTLVEHIDALWRFLTRHPQEHPQCGSMLQLPHPYVVPGGRFGELYYWDSYFTMLGLAESGLPALVHSMTDNFAYLIETYGHVPDGTRTYYLSRSQPPVFALMTRLCEHRGGQAAVEYLPQLRREHAFWMDGEDALRPGAAHRRSVMLADGAVLNRYWDDRCTPREEMWRTDVATASQSSRAPQDVYRDIRAAAESGWDFSSRWLGETPQGLARTSLATICTTDILPVDLNCLLHELEITISQLAHATGDAAASDAFAKRAQKRAEAIDRVFWDPGARVFVDYDWRGERRRRAVTAAAVVPLFCGIATRAQADAVVQAICPRLLAPGGFGTTEVWTGQQWDRPNGWAPLQWMAAEGFDRYGHAKEAAQIRTRWLATVAEVYRREGRLVEKYAIRADVAEPAQGGGGGEYPLQDGFGWTNGVTRRWLHEEAVNRAGRSGR